MLTLAVMFLQLAYPEMTYHQAYMSTVRHLWYDKWGRYSLDELMAS